MFFKCSVIFLTCTKIYHCNINSVGRICHNIFDRNYNAQITMRDILNAVYGLLIVPEPDDPLDRLDSRPHTLIIHQYCTCPYVLVLILFQTPSYIVCREQLPNLGNGTIRGAC